MFSTRQCRSNAAKPNETQKNHPQTARYVSDGCHLLLGEIDQVDGLNQFCFVGVGWKLSFLFVLFVLNGCTFTFTDMDFLCGII